MKVRVIFTALLSIAAGVAIVWWGQEHPLGGASEDGWGLAATIGSREAPVELVVVEDFLCPSCRAFHQKYFSYLILLR